MIRYLLLFLSINAYAVDSTINIQQIGDNNTIAITQDNAGHAVSIDIGKTSNVDNTSIGIVQQGTGVKAISIEILSGINNGINISQDGAGNHNSAIQSFIGSGNSVAIDQQGSGNHTFTMIGGSQTTNNGNTITASQLGSGSKTFQLNMNGTVGATVDVQQTNLTQSNTGSMSVQCVSGSCGSYSYIRN